MLENEWFFVPLCGKVCAGMNGFVKVGTQRKKSFNDDKLIVVGGVIPKQDYVFLYEKGVKCIFGPGSNIGKSASTILESLIKTYS